MKKIILIFFILNSQFSIFNSFCQPAIQWEKSLGGTNYDVAYSIIQTIDGGYIVAGTAESDDGDIMGFHSGEDCWIVKLDNSGSIQWEKSYGDSSGYSIAQSIVQTNDGGYIFAGYTTSQHGEVIGIHPDTVGNDTVGYYPDAWIVKIDDTGAIQWAKCYGGSKPDYVYSIQQTFDGGYVFTGYTSSNDGDVSGNQGQENCWVVKLNYTGAIQWSKCYGGTGTDRAFSITQTPDSGYIFTGMAGSSDGDVTGNHGNGDYWVVKLDTGGTMQWEKCYGGGGTDQANSIINTYDGGYAVAGYTGSPNGDATGGGFHGNWDYWVVKLSDTGAIQWQKCYGGSNEDQANSIAQTRDSGYAITGYTISTDGDVTRQYVNNSAENYWVVKLNNSGTIQWNECLGSTNGGEYPYSIVQTFDNGFAIAGFSNGTNGNVTGHHGPPTANPDYWIVKLYPDTAMGINEVNYYDGINVYPNPSNSVLNIQLSSVINKEELFITDVLGNTVYHQKLIGINNSIDVSKWSDGVYFYQVTNDKETYRGKFVVEK